MNPKTYHVCWWTQQVVTSGVQTDSGDRGIMGSDHLSTLRSLHSPYSNGGIGRGSEHQLLYKEWSPFIKPVQHA